MIVHIVITSLVALGTFCLCLAFLAAILPTRDRKSANNPAESDQTTSEDDVREFGRLITDDAPNLLKHLSHWRIRKSGKALRAIVASYIETSGLETRNHVLSIFIDFYVPDYDDPDLLLALDTVLEKMEDASSLSDNAKTLLREIRATSPAQLLAWSMLRTLVDLSEIKAFKLKKRLADISRKELPPRREGIESEMAHLVESLNSLTTELSKRLPSERSKAKEQRRVNLQDSLSFMDEWVKSSPAFSASEIAALPEGAICRELARRLWISLNDSLQKSGGREIESDWPNPPTVRTRRNMGARRKVSIIMLGMFAAALYIFAALIFFRVRST